MANQADWEKYERLVYALFQKHFSEHANTFKIESLNTGAVVNAPAAARQGVSATKTIETATWDADGDRKWITTIGDEEFEFNHFTNHNIPFWVQPQDYSFELDTLEEVTRERGTYTYLTPLYSAFCNPLTTDNGSIHWKLTTGTQILQRYVGSWLAAVIEMLADKLWKGSDEIEYEKIQADVLNFEWGCTGDGTDFFNDLIRNLQTSLMVFLPAKCWDFTTWVEPDSTGAQKEFQSMYIDYTLGAKADEDPVVNQFDAKINGTIRRIQQVYSISTILVEIKVNKVGDNSEKKHRLKAAMNVQPLNGSGVLKLEEESKVISTCYCLSHGKGEDGQSVSAATTLAVEPRTNMIRAVNVAISHVPAPTEGFTEYGQHFPLVDTYDNTYYTVRDVPFVRYNSLKTTFVGSEDEIKFVYDDTLMVKELTLTTGDKVDVLGDTEVLVES